FLPAGHAPPPRLTFRQLLEGLLWAAAGWFFLGLALAQLLAGVLADPPGFSPHTIGAIVGVYAFAHVSGFLALPVPGGLGVREAVLQKMLVLLPVTSMIDAGAAAAAALLFRAVQVVAEIALALFLYPWELVTRGRR
ncbi:MAG: hypothetical protein K1X57_20850, partial [Gemmataceae bacterium]|nr:hypothetical protein [Gemmataceae bacterium]